jgi:Copper transport outer membrane protein, MctB
LGYSARYHAASLAAVFLALAIGILIGVGLGEGVVSGTEESLRDSLEGDIDEARADADDLRLELDRERDFGSRAYPALVGEALSGRRIGVIALGGLSGDLEADIQEALEPTGAELVDVSVVQLPPDTAELAAAAGRPFIRAAENDARLAALGERLGRQIVLGGGRQLERARGALFSRSSGEGGSLRGVILTRASFDDLTPREEATTEAGRGATVAVEGTEAPESFVPLFSGFEVSTVDDIDLTAGKVAMVFALLGAEGNFGIKDSADSLLPELLVPAGRRPRGG